MISWCLSSVSELAHVVKCAEENVLNLRGTQFVAF